VELTPDPDALTAALLQLSEHASLLSALDARCKAHAAETGERIAALTALANAIKTTADGQAAILAGLTALTSRVDDLAARLDQVHPDDDGDPTPAYRPGAQPRFWQLQGPARDQAVTRLRAWVDQVYQPGYGHLAAALARCWEQHPLCLYTLDWLSELWSALYLDPCRTPGTLAGQAEWQTRLLAAAADEMTRETTRCGHAPSRTSRSMTAQPRP
jgi:hypothetical protein